MKKYDAKAIRNVCLLSHVGVGKTSLLEAASFTSGAVKKLGKVDDGTSHFDTRFDEKERKMTISMAMSICEWKDTKINIIDTPGFLDFLGDMRAGISAVETGIVLIDASSGIQVGTEQVVRIIDENKKVKVFFVNSINKEKADFNKTLDMIKKTYGTSVAPLQIPIGNGNDFKGIINLITKEAYEYIPKGNGKGKEIDIPSELSESVEEIRGSLIETIAESDEELMEKYFDAGELTEEEIRKGLKKGVSDGLIFPLLCGCASENIGTDLFMDAIVEILPSADSVKEIEVLKGEEKKMIECSSSKPFSAFVFKTISEEHVGELNFVRVYSGVLSAGADVKNTSRGHTERLGNVSFLRGREKIETDKISTGDIGGLLKLKGTHTNDTLAEKGNEIKFPKIEFGEPLVNIAITAKNKGDEDKISEGFKKLNEEDATFSYKYHSDIRQSILSACGDHHLEIIIAALKRRFKVEVNRNKPKISYRETVTRPVKYVEYIHKKQTGGAGQYARVFIDLEPLQRGEGYEFVDKIVGGVIDAPLRPSVDKGVKAKLKDGILAGYPIVDLKVTLVDGKTHPVDSKDIAFQIAGREVFKKAFEMASPILLEPIADVSVTMPEEYMGDVMGDLSSRRGKVSGMKLEGKYQVIKAKAPEAELQTYSQALRSMTQGRGFYSKSFSHYDPVPHELAKKVVEETNAGNEKE